MVHVIRELSGNSSASDPISFKPGVQYLWQRISAGFLETQWGEDIDAVNLDEAHLEILASVLSTTVMGKLGRFGNELGEVIEWQDEDFHSLAWCNVGDLPRLKVLRTQFAPAHLLNSAVEFLLDPEIAKLWFELYLLSISPFALHSHNDEHVTETAGVASEAGSRLVESDLERENDPEISHSIKPMDNQQSAVRMACCIGLTSIIPDILENCSLQTEDKRTEYLPLHRAALGGYLKTAQVLLDLLDDPGQIDRDGRTPLHLATLGGHVEIVRLLLGKCEVTDSKKRTDIPHIIDSQDGKRQTPLMLASQMGHIDCARHLIESGADISIKDATGKTVVHYAVLNCPEIIKYVAGQDSIYSIDNEGCTPLHIAAKYGSALDNAKKTALTHAAEQGHTEVVKILLERQGHAVTYDEYHAGELYAAELAAADGHLVTLRVLIGHHSERRMIKDAILGDHLLKEC
ncbi:ankyrin repeat-containing domain protein [Aspergillus arachidicola]|uniref:Ankyrin repeat-containing domain protein n=1 Tax=Aspergillus arachidicola TaxID=656916 RepID=A0A5N6XVS9_9EURO|nr:ankyrin repeat-containing domain protein [Aspergillus arachidicola]